MKKLTHSEAGKLGAEKSRPIVARKLKERIEKYNSSPTVCKFCDSTFTYDQRHKKFCNRSCSASYNNRKRSIKEVTWNCLSCDKEHKSVPRLAKKYCSIACQMKHQQKERIRQWLEEGKDWKLQVPSWAKLYLAKVNGNKCSVCNLTTWNDEPITLECDHIDGHHENNNIDNLRLICPNCHSQTDTYKAKNTGNGRKYRRQ